MQLKDALVQIFPGHCGIRARPSAFSRRWRRWHDSQARALTVADAPLPKHFEEPKKIVCHVARILARELPFGVGLPERTRGLHIVTHWRFPCWDVAFGLFLPIGHEGALLPSHVRGSRFRDNEAIAAMRRGSRFRPVNSAMSKRQTIFLHFGKLLSGLRQQPDGQPFWGEGSQGRKRGSWCGQPRSGNTAHVSARLGLDGRWGTSPGDKNFRRRRSLSFSQKIHAHAHLNNQSGWWKEIFGNVRAGFSEHFHTFPSTPFPCVT
jgi:hypothetical protein